MLFHHARYGRGEYINTALKFNDLGYNCLAIDPRSGNEVKSKTFLQAQEKGLGTQYKHAMPDLKTAIKYVQSNY